MQPDDNIDDVTSPLAEDNDTPFSPPDQTQNDGTNTDDELDDTHPATDTNNDPMEAYDEGTSGAAEVSEPSRQSAIPDFNEEE